MCTQGNIIIMHSHTVMTNVVNECVHQFKSEKSWCSVSRLANKRDKMCAQGNIIIIHSQAVMDKEETSVCTVCKKQRTRVGERLLSFHNVERGLCGAASP